MIINVFRPQGVNKKYIRKLRLTTGEFVSHSWQTRVKWYPAGYKSNHRVIANQFRRLHYLAEHAPLPVRKQWKNAYSRFYLSKFGTLRASVRYLNRYSCHAWM